MKVAQHAEHVIPYHPQHCLLYNVICSSLMVHSLAVKWGTLQVHLHSWCIGVALTSTFFFRGLVGFPLFCINKMSDFSGNLHFAF